jgi:hypothetical protein
MAEETHTYHHYDPSQPQVDLEVNQTTRGLTWSVAVKGCSTVEQALSLYSEAVTGLSDLLEPESEDDAETEES